MKKFLQNKKGVTLLEGLIALLLLAVVATGTFGVLLSVSRKSNVSDIRAEMAATVQRVRNEMKYSQNYLPYRDDENTRFCPDDDNTYSLRCYLPPICDRNKSSFTFTYKKNMIKMLPLKSTDLDSGIVFNTNVPTPMIEFYITCNGFTL